MIGDSTNVAGPREIYTGRTGDEAKRKIEKRSIAAHLI
jgi:hypothetical protein